MKPTKEQRNSLTKKLWSANIINATRAMNYSIFPKSKPIEYIHYETMCPGCHLMEMEVRIFTGSTKTRKHKVCKNCGKKK
jgi:hypothetical protein